jgi:hypothetical protein
MNIAMPPIVIVHALYYMHVDLNNIGPKILNSCHKLALNKIFMKTNIPQVLLCNTSSWTISQKEQSINGCLFQI